MGLTHYWKRQGEIPEAVWDALVRDVEALVRHRAESLSLDGNPALPPVVDSKHIQFNGRGADAHETFYFPRVNPMASNKSEWSFCKTNRLPYDEVVVATLCVLKKHLGSLIVLRSDGSWGDDWGNGRRLVEDSLGYGGELLSSVESDLRPKPKRWEFVASLGHFLVLPKPLLQDMLAQLNGETLVRLGVDLADLCFFLMPREFQVVRRQDGTCVLSVDLLSADNAFTHPAAIGWRDELTTGGARHEVWWEDLPEDELRTFLEKR